MPGTGTSTDAPRTRRGGAAQADAQALACVPTVPLFDLRLEEEDLQAVADTLRSGWLSMGPRTEAFEEAFAAHLEPDTPSRSPAALPRFTSRTWRPASDQATR